MSERRLPAAAQALGSLRVDGNQFATVPLAPRLLGGVLFVDPQDGPGQVEADDRVLQATGRVYTSNAMLRRQLRERRARAGTMVEALRLIAGYYRQERVMWGVSGYASIGPDCGPEADLLEALYGYFVSQKIRRPSVVYDGGAGAGALGINGVLGAEHRICTLGVTPLKGIASMAPRDHMLVYGHTYRQREVIVGSLPDALVVAGGGDGAMREAVGTVNAGGRVLLAGRRGLAASWGRVPALVSAKRMQRLVICQDPSGIAEAAEQMRRAVLSECHQVRPQRFRTLTQRLHPQP